jgi:hypothetical protein
MERWMGSGEAPGGTADGAGGGMADGAGGGMADVNGGMAGETSSLESSAGEEYTAQSDVVTCPLWRGWKRLKVRHFFLQIVTARDSSPNESTRDPTHEKLVKLVSRRCQTSTGRYGTG